MKGLLYSLVKHTVRSGLYCYHKRIKIFGLENIPIDKPVLFLPNHQSALIDVLLIATNCNRKPFFLTRADVFSSSLLKRIFSYFRMLPIYRMRDGRNTLSNNNLIFDECASFLNRKEAIVIFPEANHSLKRRVRPLSKGFTRIILRALELNPHLDIQLVPVGLNYKQAAHFPDEVAVYYGKSISVKSLYNETDLNASSLAIKDEVSLQLKQLTTHIPEDFNYDKSIQKLQSENANFLHPKEINNRMKGYIDDGLKISNLAIAKSAESKYFKSFLIMLNFPVVLLWHLVVKQKVPEAEFIGTFKFATSLTIVPLYLVFLVLILSLLLNLAMAFLVVALIIILNLLLVKYLLK